MVRALGSNYRLTIFLNGQTGTFARDNWTSIIHFAVEYYKEDAQDVVVIILRRFESGPKTTSSIPYKTLAGAIYIDNTWYGQTYDQIKQAHTTDHSTGKKLPVEEGVLFADFCEEYTTSPARKLPKY